MEEFCWMARWLVGFLSLPAKNRIGLFWSVTGQSILLHLWGGVGLVISLWTTGLGGSTKFGWYRIKKTYHFLFLFKKISNLGGTPLLIGALKSLFFYYLTMPFHEVSLGLVEWNHLEV